jgi:hypothetical protein
MFILKGSTAGDDLFDVLIEIAVSHDDTDAQEISCRIAYAMCIPSMFSNAMVELNLIDDVKRNGHMKNVSSSSQDVTFNKVTINGNDGGGPPLIFPRAVKSGQSGYHLPNDLADPVGP